MQENEKGWRGVSVMTERMKEMTVYGRHFITKPQVIFSSQEKKMILNVLWSSISIQSVPNSSQNLEVIKYKDIVNFCISTEKEKEVILLYNNRKAQAGKTVQSQHIFKSEDRVSLIADYYKGIDLFNSYHNIRGTQMQFGSITAQLIVDKTTKSYYECRLTCFNSILIVEFIKASYLSPDKFKRVYKSMFYSNSKVQISKEQESNTFNNIEVEDDSSNHQANEKERNVNTSSTNQNSNSNEENLIEEIEIRQSIIYIKYKDIYRIQKKSNGFIINLQKPSLQLSFFNNDLNQVNQFINRIQKNWKDVGYKDISVTATLQEEIHNPIKFNEKEMEIDFAIFGRRILQSKCHKRKCILGIGKGGIYEVDIIDNEVYEYYDLKYLKDIIRQESNGSLKNSIKLVFLNGMEVEYVFDPFQRDILIVELLTNITMYYDNSSYCRRCLDIIHSRTPNYTLEIYGWKTDSGYSERDVDVDQELIKNLLAKGDEQFFSALREFNVNCNLKRLMDADINVYKHLINVLHKHLSFLEDHDLLYFIKHMKILKTIPSISKFPFSSLDLLKNQDKSSQDDESQGMVSDSILYSNRREEHNLKLYSLQKDATNRFIDEEYGHHNINQQQHQQQEQDSLDNIEEDMYSTQHEDDDVFDIHMNISPSNTPHKHQKSNTFVRIVHEPVPSSPQSNPFSKYHEGLEEQQSVEKDKININHHDQKKKDEIAESKSKQSPRQQQLDKKIFEQEHLFKKQQAYLKHFKDEEKKRKNDPRKLMKLCVKQEYSLQDEELLQQMRIKSLKMLKKLKKKCIKHHTDQTIELQLNAEAVEAHLQKIEELLKCLTLFQNCKRYFEDKSIKIDKFKDFRTILLLLSNPDPLIVYQTSQLFKRIGFYHSNSLQKQEADNKNFLLDPRFNILDRVFYQISNYTLIQRPLTRFTFMIRIFSCLSIINTLFQARIESTAQQHRLSIIQHLQSPVFYAVVGSILRYNSFSLIVNTINLLNALYFFSIDNKPFINMIIQNSTLIIFLIHLIIQDIYPSKQLKDITFNLLFNLLYQKPQACYVVMNIFPKPLFKMLRTESSFVDQWTKQEWQQFFFTQIQQDIKSPYYFWLKSNLKLLDDTLLDEDSSFLEQQTLNLFKRIHHASDLQDFYPNLFQTAVGGAPQEIQMTQLVAIQNATLMPKKSATESQEAIKAREAQKEVFASVYWNIDDFKIEYDNVNDQQQCGKYYLKQLLGEGKRLLFDFIDAKNQVMEKEVKELWENLVGSFMNGQSQSMQRQLIVIRMMTVIYKEYSKTIKTTNIIPYLIHIINLKQFWEAQYPLIQFIMTLLISEDSQSKQMHAKIIVDNDGIQQLLNVIFQRISILPDNTLLLNNSGIDSSPLKLKEAKIRQEENLYVIFLCLKMIQSCIQLHSHIYKKREVFPETKPQKICFENKNWRLLMNILLLVQFNPGQQSILQQVPSQQQQSQMPYEAAVRNEYLKLLLEYLMNDSMLYVNGFVELVMYSLSEHTSRITFTLIKHLFFRLNDAHAILDQIVNGVGLTQEHLTVFPFFKYLPIQLLLLLLVEDPQVFNTPFEQRVIKQNSYVPQNNNDSTPINISSRRDENVDSACENYKSDNLERYDLIWGKRMRIILREHINAMIQEYKDKLSSYYQTNFNVKTSVWSHFTIMSEQIYKNYPLLSLKQQQSNEQLIYPNLQGEISACQIYLRPWSVYPDISHSHLPHAFAARTISLISKYSFRQDIFNIQSNSDDNPQEVQDQYALCNLRYLLKSQIKIYKLKVPTHINYPYHHLLPIMSLAKLLLFKLNAHNNNVSNDTNSNNNNNDNNNIFNSANNLSTRGAPAQQDQKIFFSDGQCDKGDDEELNSNVFEMTNKNDLQKLDMSQWDKFVEEQIKIAKENVNCEKQQASQPEYQQSPSELFLELIRPHLCPNIKKIIKLIFLSIQEKENMDTFCQKEGGVESIIQLLHNVVQVVYKKSVKNYQEGVDRYLDQINISYSEVKIIEYSIKTLECIYQAQKDKFNNFNPKERKYICLLLQRTQKISIVFFQYFLEKQHASPAALSSSTGASNTNNIAEPNTPLGGGNCQTANQLLDKVFFIDKKNILCTSDQEVEKHFKAVRRLNVAVSSFVFQLAKNINFIKSLVQSGSAWRALEIILVRGKPFTTLKTNQRAKNLENVNQVTFLASKILGVLAQNCEFIKKFESSLHLNSFYLKKGSLQSIESPIKKMSYNDTNDNMSQGSSKESLNVIQLASQDIRKCESISNQSLPGASAKYLLNKPIIAEIPLENEMIIEEEQSKSDESGSTSHKNVHLQIGSAGLIKSESPHPTHQEDEIESGDSSNSSHINNRKITEEERKEMQFINMHYLKEIGSNSREKLLFFVTQFQTALSKNVDNHLLRYLREEKHEQFCRKINNNIELPDFIWNQLSRDNLDFNLKQQIININNSDGQIFLDKLLQHQGIIQLAKGESNKINAQQEQQNLQTSKLEPSEISLQNNNNNNSNNSNLSEVFICGVSLKIFNESDNFELTNPQTFQSEVYTQFKSIILQIETVLLQLKSDQEKDQLESKSSSQCLLEQLTIAAKECIKATCSLLTRYSISNIVLNPDNISAFFRLLEMDLDGSLDVSGFKIQIVKIINELSGQQSSIDLLILSNVLIKYIITNILNSNTTHSQQIHLLLLNSILKTSHVDEHSNKIISCRLISVLLLNILKKEYYKSGFRVQIVEVINEIAQRNETLLNYLKLLFPIRIYQKLYSSNHNQSNNYNNSNNGNSPTSSSANIQNISSISVLEILDNVQYSYDMIWNNDMRLELIMVLQQDIEQYLKDEDESREFIQPQYPYIQNELTSTQIFLRIFNLIPASAKLSDLNHLVPFLKSENNKESVSCIGINFSDEFLNNLIGMIETYQISFINMQNINLQLQDSSNNLMQQT